MIKNILGSFAMLWALTLTALPIVLSGMNPLFRMAVAYFPLVLLCGKGLLKDRLFLSALFLSFISYCISYENKLGTVIPLILVPAILIYFVKHSNGFSFSYRLVAYLIFLINCAIVIYEYNNQVNLLSFDLSDEIRFRATGLWMHPLMNAILHTVCVFFILLSSVNKYIKIVSALLGVYIIFMFDARLATVTLILGMIYIAYLYGFLSVRKIVYVLIICVVVYYFVQYLETNDLGGKLFDSNKNTMNDASTVARIKAFQMLWDADWKTIVFGADKFKILPKYHCIEIENAAIEFVFFSGAIVVVPFLYIYITGIYKMMDRIPKVSKILVLGTLLFVGMFCSSYSKSFLWIAFIVFYQGFGPYDQLEIKSSHSKKKCCKR